MATDCVALFSSSALAEAVTYTPAGGAPLSILAIIDRHPIAPVDNARQIAADEVVVSIRNAATVGVVAPARGDRIALPVEVGGATVSYRVAEILSGDAGVWSLACNP